MGVGVWSLGEGRRGCMGMGERVQSNSRVVGSWTGLIVDKMKKNQCHC